MIRLQAEVTGTTKVLQVLLLVSLQRRNAACSDDTVSTSSLFKGTRAEDPRVPSCGYPCELWSSECSGVWISRRPPSPHLASRWRTTKRDGPSRLCLPL